MEVIVENKVTGKIHTINTNDAPMVLTPILLVRPGQGSVHRQPIRKVSTRNYTTDGCNKVEKTIWRRVFGVHPPYPCWKYWKRSHQYKREGHASARALNLMDRCIYPYISREEVLQHEETF